MKIGYTFSGNSSNEGIFFENAPEGVCCPNCGTCLDYSYHPAFLDIHPSQKYDVSYTHDLRRVFSSRFVDFCKETLGCREDFKLINTPKFELYYMFPREVVKFDIEKRETRFEKPCNLCGGHESIVGAHPAFLKTNSPLGPGFYRSDIPFASGSSKFPLFFVGEEWKELLFKQKFRGLCFEEVGS